MTAIAILSALVGLNVAVKIISLCKILGINIEGYSQQDFEKLLEDPKFRKYMR
jgi:hypothetical protein